MFNRHHFNQVLITLSLLLSFKLALAIVPPTLNYQGHLTDSAGTPIDGPVNMVFSIYDIAAGGTALWSDTRSVTIDQGIFSVELGGGLNPFPLGLFENPLWMGLTVDTDAEMLPRRPLSSTAYSFKADDANTIEGISASTLDQSGHVIDTANPHNVTAAQTGAANAATLSAHTGNVSNPHSVTAAQTGAATSASFSLHTGDASAHHAKTTNYSELTGTVQDANIASTITRDSELASHSASQSVHHARYADSEAVAAIKAADGAGSTLDADLLDGLQASEVIDAAQDEVRTPISALPYTITQPGSYYLTGNLTATSGGINISTDDVTLDLMGFTLDGNGVSDYGIYMLSQSNITIKNGTIKGFGFAGIYQSNTSDGYNIIIDVKALANGTLGSSTHYSGIYLHGINNHIERCVAANNGGYGIYAFNYAKLRNNTVYANAGLYGIYGGDNAIISNNSAYNNGSYGIYGNTGASINDNSVYLNSGWGISGAGAVTIKGNAVHENNTDNDPLKGGLFVSHDSMVIGNTLDANSQHNIYVGNGDNTIENNLVTDSANGITFLLSGNFYGNNRAAGNTVNHYNLGTTVQTTNASLPNISF